MLRGILKFISPEQIQEALQGITKTAIENKKDYPLEKGEDLHAILLYDIDGEAYASVVAIKDTWLSEKMVISRYIETRKVADLAELIINKI
jgi:hypothetical protein